jgi:hypothetical protein
MDIEQHGRRASFSSYTSIAVCPSCGRVAFAGCWQDVEHGLHDYLVAHADARATCPGCSELLSGSPRLEGDPARSARYALGGVGPTAKPAPPTPPRA